MELENMSRMSKIIFTIILISFIVVLLVFMPRISKKETSEYYGEICYSEQSSQEASCYHLQRVMSRCPIAYNEFTKRGCGMMNITFYNGDLVWH